MANQAARVPKFGNWESGDSIPYTTCFESARRGKTAGKLMINPNVPQEDPVLGPEAAGPRNGDVVQHHQTAGSPLRKPPSQRRYEERRASRRKSGGSDRSFEQSPLNPNYQLDTTPGRGRGRQGAGARGNETAGNGSSLVPKFGDWDESNPASADGYTHIFNRVRKERNVGSPRVPSELNSKNPDGDESESKGCGCFGF